MQIKNFYEILEVDKDISHEKFIISFQKRRNVDPLQSYVANVLVSPHLRELYDALPNNLANQYNSAVQLAFTNLKSGIKKLKDLCIINKENSLLIVHTLSEIYLINGKNQDAINLLNEVTKEMPEPILLMVLCSCYFRINDGKKANIVAQKIFDQNCEKNIIGELIF